MKELFFTCLIILSASLGYAQKGNEESVFWKLTSLNGEFNLNGNYFDQKTNRNLLKERRTDSDLSGGLFVNTSSYFWHPNFMKVDLDVGYSPETGQELSLVAPDQAEVNTLKKLNAAITLFQNSKVNLKTFTNLYKGFSNRENLTNIETESMNWGSILTYNNKYLPFVISYTDNSQEQKELATNRNFKIDNTNLQGSVNKSFGLNDNHQFRVNRNENVYEDRFLFSERNQSGIIVKNDITSWSLIDNIYFDSKKKYRFNSAIFNEDQQGDTYNLKRFEIIEDLTLLLPANFDFSSNFSYINIKTDVYNSEQKNVSGKLFHQLYKSLRSSATVEFINIQGSQFMEKEKRFGLNLSYIKEIPLNGLLSLSYNINSNQESRSRTDQLQFIRSEKQQLTDSKMVLLNEQYADIESVIVKDETGTITYQLFFDYILIQRNELLEIQRIPGGRIADKTNIYIDYISIQPSSYRYNSVQNYFIANVSLFKNKLQFYYNNSRQDYLNPQNIEFLTLDYFNQNVYGSQINFGFLSAGIEQDNYKSTVVPYRLRRYFLILQGNLNKKLTYSFNYTIRDYQMLIVEGSTQKYYNMTGTFSYIINNLTRLDFQGSYLKQEGVGIDLNLFSSRVELSTRFSQIYVKMSLELYKNKFYAENLDFRKVSIQISRKF